MEIRSCEQYVLAELEELRAENERLKDRLADALQAVAMVAAAVADFTETLEEDADE